MVRLDCSGCARVQVTVAVIADDRVGTSVVTSFYRFQGTVLGSIVGYLVMVVFGVRVPVLSPLVALAVDRC